MPVEVQVMGGGAKLRHIAPVDAIPHILYSTLLANGEQGPFVTCRINEQGEKQIGPMHPSLAQNDILGLVEFPEVKRIIIEGVSDLRLPTAEQVVQLVGEYFASRVKIQI